MAIRRAPRLFAPLRPATGASLASSASLASASAWASMSSPSSLPADGEKSENGNVQHDTGKPLQTNYTTTDTTANNNNKDLNSGGQTASIQQQQQQQRLRAVVFDVDGTLCLPQNYMFGEMRAALGITKAVDILDHIYSLPPLEQGAAMDKIKVIERAAMSKQTPQPGLSQLMAYLDSRQIPKAICTRNFNGPVDHLLQNFLPGSAFHPIVTRDFRPPKPDPAGILYIASSLLDSDQERHVGGSDYYKGIKASMHSESMPLTSDLPLIMVGDSIDDMRAGRRAGAATVLLVNPDNSHLADHECTDLVISRLDELIGILEDGFRSGA